MQLQTEIDAEYLGELSIQIEYDYQPSEERQDNPDHPRFGPGCAEDADITSVIALIDGAYIQVMGIIPEFYMKLLEEKCLEDYHSGEEE